MWETAQEIDGKPEGVIRAHTLLHCESFFATLECELIERESYATRSEARLSVFDFVEGWYNPHRLHSALDYQSPMSYEEDYYPDEMPRFLYQGEC
jgi:transposase InsO family protein